MMRYKSITAFSVFITIIALQLNSLAGPKPKIDNDEVRFSVTQHNGKSVLSIEFGDAKILVDEAVVLLKEGKEGKIGVSKNGDVEFRTKDGVIEAEVIKTRNHGGLLE